MGFLMKAEIMKGMTEEEFYKFCQDNDTLNFERNANGEIIVITPTGSEMGSYNSEINWRIGNWNKERKMGRVFDSNAGFTLPNRSVRAADSAFIRQERWENVAKEDRKRFAHICPDFVIEIQLETDDSKTLQDKMKEWIENGCQLAWMINPEKRETWIYRKNGEEEIKPFAMMLDGEDVLPDFEIDLQKIFAQE